MTRAWVCAACLVGCGPAADVHDPTAAEASSDGDTTASTAATGADTESATSTATQTSTSDGGPGGYEDDDGGTGCTFTCPDPPGPSTGGGGGGGVDFECDIWGQDCPEGQKCMPWANDGGTVHSATKCGPLDPSSGQIGEPCHVEGSFVSGVDDCDVGLWCSSADPNTNDGLCYELCHGSPVDPICNAPDTACVILYGFLPLCTAPCDPLADTCGTGAGCYPIGSGFSCLPTGPEPVGAGDTCETPESCQPGLYCVHASVLPACGAARCCTDFCDVAHPSGDAQCSLRGTTCTLLAEDAPSAVWEDLGACLGP